MAEALPVGEAEVLAFVEKWSLDANSVALLRNLAPADQAKALAGFKPHASTQNFNGKFASWLKWSNDSNGSSKPKPRPIGSQPLSGLAARSQPPPGFSPLSSEADNVAPLRSQEEMERLAGTDAVATFLERWTLDDGASAMLSELPVAVRLSVLEGFNPGSNTRSYGGRLQAYVRSMQRGSNRPGAKAAESVPAEALEEFIQKWELDAETAVWLKQLPAEVCAGTLSTFSPPDDTKNMNNRLKAFVNRRFAPQAVVQTSCDITQFVSKWGLDDRSQALLGGLRPNVLNVVLSEFEPPLGTSSIGGLLASFVRGAANRSSNGIPTPSRNGSLGWQEPRSRTAFIPGVATSWSRAAPSRGSVPSRGRLGAAIGASSTAGKKKPGVSWQVKATESAPPGLAASAG